MLRKILGDWNRIERMLGLVLGVRFVVSLIPPADYKANLISWRDKNRSAKGV